ncbi:MAG: class I SAM-dependent rRNA methyltransferase [Gammaproteobacteria bacterium]|nr:class I SAM-dependent rRNA methyltransferase [Gammaproteobacteria bacterium]
MTHLPQLLLKKDEDRRLRAGHEWIYSNEVDVARTPLKNLVPGSCVNIARGDGKIIGSAYVNPHSLICARLYSRKQDTALDQSLVQARIALALQWRQRAFSAPYYRLVYGESDQLPGLIVDRYGDFLVVQINTAGMERVRNELIEALVTVLKPRGILLRNDSGAREQEGLSREVVLVYGEFPDRIECEENGARYELTPFSGQKTGWFYDHRLNRARAAHYAPGRRVLDVFSYLGAWAMPMAMAGAESVTVVDSSSDAIKGLLRNAERNGVRDRFEARTGEAQGELKKLIEEKRQFDLIVLDPPAFVKRKKDLEEGVRAYFHHNQMALRLLATDGILVSASCSFHLPEEKLIRIVADAARQLNRPVQLVERGHQGPDHPVHPAIVETDYLKAVFFRVV